MGFMGMKVINDSDTTFDFVQKLGRDIASSMEEELEEKGNSINTDGIENVALTFEGIILPGLEAFRFHDHLVKVAKKCRRGLKRKLKSKLNKEFHPDYERMVKSLDKYIKEAK